MNSLLFLQELSAEDMESQLNPNAAEFVPVYSTSVEPDIAGSPQKGMERSLENISIPSPNDFFKEICKRPSDIGGIVDSQFFFFFCVLLLLYILSVSLYFL